MNAELLLVRDFLADHPEEAARELEQLEPADLLPVLAEVPPEVAARVLVRLAPPVAGDVLQGLPADQVHRIAPWLPQVPVAQILYRLPPEARDAVLERLPPREAAGIRGFLEYPPESVGALMDARVFALPGEVTVQQALDQLRRHAPSSIQNVHVVDREQVLIGLVPLRDLALAAPELPLLRLMHTSFPSIQPFEPHELIVELHERWGALSIPVVDLDGRLLGVVRTASIVRAGQEEAAADILTMVGASPDERALSPVGFAVRKRVPWLHVNLATAFLAALVVGLFEDTIARITALAVLLPVVAGQAGNAGAQSLAVVMRGLALRDIRVADWWRVSRKEFGVAFFNGAAISLSSGLAVWVWSGNPGLVAVIAASMIISMCTAGVAGAVVPMVLRQLNQDPAQSSSIILTTVTDVVGFSSFLGLATLLASWIV